MRWWDIDQVLDLEGELFPDDAWSRGMFWSELAGARHPAATRHYVVAGRGRPRRSATAGSPRSPAPATYRPSGCPATTGAPASAHGC